MIYSYARCVVVVVVVYFNKLMRLEWEIYGLHSTRERQGIKTGQLLIWKNV
jgi:hypothetical protein